MYTNGDKMPSIFLIASVNAVLNLKTGDTVSRELFETFELLELRDDLHKTFTEKIIDENDFEDAVQLYKQWIKSLEPTLVRLTTADHYLGDPEGPVNPESFSLTSLEELHIQALDEWLEDHQGWYVSVEDGMSA